MVYLVSDFSGREAVMVPTGEPANTIETARHSYIDELQPREERRKELKVDFFYLLIHCCSG